MNAPDLTPEMAEAVRLAVMTTYSMTDDEHLAAARAVHRAVRIDVLANVAKQAIHDARVERQARARILAAERNDGA